MNKPQVIDFIIEVVVTDRFHCISDQRHPKTHVGLCLGGYIMRNCVYKPLWWLCVCAMGKGSLKICFFPATYFPVKQASTFSDPLGKVWIQCLTLWHQRHTQWQNNPVLTWIDYDQDIKKWLFLYNTAVDVEHGWVIASDMVVINHACFTPNQAILVKGASQEW